MVLNDGNRKPIRSSYNNAHAYLSAPYGIYKTKDSFLAIAMTPVPALGELLGLSSITKFNDQKDWFTKRDEIKKLIGEWLVNQTTDHWLSILQPAFNKISKNTKNKNQIELLEKESIKNSLHNLFTFPNIKKSVKNNTLSMHGLIHDIGSGGLKYLNPLTKEFENISPKLAQYNFEKYNFS